MNKTISINPTLFSIGKTKKNREKKLHPKNVPLISPNVLKNKLLKRIKEHKVKENEKQKNNRQNFSNTKDDTDNVSEYTDEFNDSINYLQTLSKQQKNDDNKANIEQNKKRLLEHIEKSTVKNYQSLIGGEQQKLPFVNIDLPEELKELKEPVFNMNNLSNTSSLILNTYKKDDIPYGVLKGGFKPTYRDWSKTQRNLTIANPYSCITIDENINKQNIERENRLNKLKNNIREKNILTSSKISIPEQISTINEEDIMITQNLIQKPKIDIITEENIYENQIINNNNSQLLTIDTNKQQNGINIGFPIKRIIKKTIRRKYTLGKSKIKKTVGILLKDRGTRKVILSAQRELKKKPINDIKSYLRHHNLIKIGSNAPNDVIRKLYESAMLAGEITNTNSETLLHNFTKEDTEL